RPRSGRAARTCRRESTATRRSARASRSSRSWTGARCAAAWAGRFGSKRSFVARPRRRTRLAAICYRLNATPATHRWRFSRLLSPRSMRAALLVGSALGLSSLVACGRPSPATLKAGDSLSTGMGGRLPTGVRLDPAAPMGPIWPMALTMRVAPEGDRVVIAASGYAAQGLQVVRAADGAVLQELPQRSAFVGLAFAPDHRSLYASGGDADVVYRYDWADGR